MISPHPMRSASRWMIPNTFRRCTTSARSLSSLPSSRDADGSGPSKDRDTNVTEDHTPHPSSVLFPWRYESSPVARLIPGTPEHSKVGLLLTSQSQNVYGSSSLNAIVTAYMFLNVPWYELFWISHFKDELSSNMSWSFTQGVASLLSNLPSYGGGNPIPANRIISEEADGTCRIDFRETIEISSVGNSAYRISVLDEDENVDGMENNGSSCSDPIDRNAVQLRQMFHEKVLELYQSSMDKTAAMPENDSSGTLVKNTQRLEVRLKMNPYDTKFIGLYAIPYLSRRNAKSDASLFNLYRKMLNTTSSGRATYLSQLRQEHLETNGYMESTIIAQCLVWCEELFYVKDLATGQILQGKEVDEDSSLSGATETQKTPHLVRMERTVITKRDPSTGNFDNERENWIITDIDDLVDGNLLV
ncbi:unnamed protein product [Pseudo-nitzschia multistriata]|uniref:Uncharacterized protein n=1 Tax=Pseudo-nitzschia multistriata TaxID=183589 RepID=A0A448ZH41_9STRA|nr:unnamed protein product [Pseudo-nitzschia multistriata]